MNALFVGSNWKPNILAMKFIEKLAEENVNNKKLLFIVAGSVGHGRKNTKNLTYTGRVRSIIPIYQKADIFINPMSTGSGVNFKVIEAMAASLPVVSTSFGVRGIKIKNNVNGIIAELPEFNNILNQLVNDRASRIKIGNGARDTALKYYARNRVINRILRFYNEL
jgi:glycosyltransferase involved in cell wall biosynthesis